MNQLSLLWCMRHVSAMKWADKILFVHGYTFRNNQCTYQSSGPIGINYYSDVPVQKWMRYIYLPDRCVSSSSAREKLPWSHAPVYWYCIPETPTWQFSRRHGHARAYASLKRTTYQSNIVSRVKTLRWCIVIITSYTVVYPLSVSAMPSLQFMFFAGTRIFFIRLLFSSFLSSKEMFVVHLLKTWSFTNDSKSSVNQQICFN